MSLKKDTQDLAAPHRQLHFAKKIIVVDGMIGGGKALLASVISSLPKVEMWLSRPQIEQICALYHLGHISLDAAKTLINTWMDEEIYHQNIGRNINFKPSDASSVFKNARTLKYLKRLFKNPLEAKESIKTEKPILNLMTHVITSYAKPLFEAVGENLVYIRVCRHPMSSYMIKHNAQWTERWEKDGRHGHILYKTFDRNSNPIYLPFYAKSIETVYLNSNSIDRAILLFDEWIRNSDNFIDEVKKSTRATIIEIPYEKFVFQPEAYIAKIALSLGVKPDKKTQKMMRRQGVPRNSLTDAPKNRYFLDMGWEAPKKKLTLDDHFTEGRNYASKTASKESLQILDKLSEAYKTRHNLII